MRDASGPTVKEEEREEERERRRYKRGDAGRSKEPLCKCCHWG